MSLTRGEKTVQTDLQAKVILDGTLFISARGQNSAMAPFVSFYISGDGDHQSSGNLLF